MYTYYYVLDDTYYKMTGEEKYRHNEYFYDLGHVYTENLIEGNSFDFHMAYATPFKLFIVKEILR